MIIRRPGVDDVDAMGALHVRAWQAAYRGVMPDDDLDGLQPSDRAEVWRRSLASSESHVLVAEVDGAVVGLAAYGRSADQTVGELYALNVDPPSWGRGAGTALLAAVTDELRAAGFGRAMLWVVPENARARRLYESAGWRPDGAQRDEEVLGVTVAEIRYALDL